MSDQLTTESTKPVQRMRAGRLTIPLIPWIFAAALLLVLPFIFTNNSAITIMNQMAITIIFALAYNMLLGQAGMLSFGHAIYLGVGGFFAIHTMNWLSVTGTPIPLPFLPIFGGLFSLGVAIIIGAFSIRRAGVVFAMISLGIVELIASYAIITSGFFNGGGVGGDRTYVEAFFGVEFLRQGEVYYLVIFWLLISTFLMYLFTRTPVGRMANAVRDNPERAEFVGYSAYWVRFCSFCAAGFFAGIAGSLFAITYEITTVENLNVEASGTILMIAFLGGVGFFFGPIIGAVVFTILQTILSLQTELWQLYIGALFVACVMFFPGGLAGVLAMHAPVLRSGKAAAIAAPYFKTLIPAGVSILALAGICEIMIHSRNAAVGESEMTLYWITFDSHNPIPWIILATLTTAGFWLARREAPALSVAWTDATRP